MNKTDSVLSSGTEVANTAIKLIMFAGGKRNLSERLGVYKYMPIFFILGAAIELFMIKVRIGHETFCKCIFWV